MSIKGIIYLVLFFLLLLSCNRGKNQRNVISLDVINHVVYDTLYKRSDILIRAKLVENGAALLEWEKDNIANIGNDTILYDSIEMRRNLLVKERFARLNLGCGSGCNMSYVMSLDFMNDGKIYMYPLAFDDQHGIIVYQGGGNNLAIIEHIESNRNHILDEDFNTQSRPISNVIKEAKLNNDTLYLRWEKDEVIVMSKYFIISSLGL